MYPCFVLGVNCYEQSHGTKKRKYNYDRVHTEHDSPDSAEIVCGYCQRVKLSETSHIITLLYRSFPSSQV